MKKIISPLIGIAVRARILPQRHFKGDSEACVDIKQPYLICKKKTLLEHSWQTCKVIIRHVITLDVAAGKMNVKN
jgi:hypothetical protein